MIRKFLYKACIYFSLCAIGYMIVVFSAIVYFNSPNKYHDTDKRFVIKKGMTLRQVVNKLHSEEIIERPTVFLYLSQLIKGLDPKVRYGEYFFEKHTSYYKILKKMSRGYIFFRKVTLAEGSSSHTAISILNSASGLTGEIPSKVKEGSILPETYFYSFNDTKAATLKRMQEAMTKTIDELWEKRNKAIPVKTKEQAIILASIVEKETGVESERPLVASVFTNRLLRGMKLQSDPTIIYSYAFGNRALERPIRMSDIRNSSAYNTYYIYGLPPSPICNPGRASIEAVLNPPKTRYLYFVANGYNKGHTFARTLREHNVNVAKYRLYIKKRRETLAAEKLEQESTENEQQEQAQELEAQTIEQEKESTENAKNQQPEI